MKRRVIAWIAACVLVAMIGAAVWYSGRDARERTTVKNHLKKIGAALHAHHDEHGHFPAAYTAGSNPVSWRVALLPYLNEADLYAKYDSVTAWDAGSNRELRRQRPDAYYCPSVLTDDSTGYQAVVGLQTVWPFDQPSAINGITDGTSNTLMVLDIHSTEVPWLAPNDLTFSTARDVYSKQSQHPDGTTCLFADGSVKVISSKVDPEVFRKLLTASGGAPAVSGLVSRDAAERLRAELDFSSEVAFAQPMPASDLPATHLTAVTDDKLHIGETVVYCPTMALAWRQYIDVMPQVALTNLAARLRESPFSATDIDPQSIRIRAGFVTGDEWKTQRDEFLGPESGDTVLRSVSDRPPEGPAVWCALKKQLAFISKFEPFSLPLNFHASDGDRSVRSFGVTSHWESWLNAIAQVRIWDDRSPDDFVIQIANLNGEDLILAKVPMPETLAMAVDDVVTRINDSTLPGNARAVVSGEKIVIPILELSLYEDFARQLNHPEQPPGTRIENATQVIQFRLDEQGATLISESEVVGENGHGQQTYEPGTRSFVFDKPFLLMLRESSDKHPYFAAWVGNTDLMVPHNE